MLIERLFLFLLGVATGFFTSLAAPCLPEGAERDGAIPCAELRSEVVRLSQRVELLERRLHEDSLGEHATDGRAPAARGVEIAAPTPSPRSFRK